MSGLEQEFGPRLRAYNVDATTPESKAVVERLGFRNHGLVVRNADGEVLWKQGDHEVDIADVRAAVDRLLNGEG